MLLHAIESGAGPRTVVLLHGMMGSAESWHRVVPRLVARGHSVLALDLPGHGLSPRDPELTIESAAASVVETVRSRAGDGPVLAVGHSYGATVLAQACDALRPALAVYVDAALSLAGGADRAALVETYEQDRRTRLSSEYLRVSRAYYSAEDAEVEARAAARFDPETMASVSCGPDHEWAPGPASVLLRAEPSAWVSDDDALRFARHGGEVRSIPGAAHTVWYSHLDPFTAALPELSG